MQEKKVLNNIPYMSKKLRIILLFLISLLITPIAFTIPKFDKAYISTPKISQREGTLEVSTNQRLTDIGWKAGFKVDPNETLKYIGPKDYTVINRIKPSEVPAIIAGKLIAQDMQGKQGGNIIFSAPGGLIIAKGATINVGRFIAHGSEIGDLRKKAKSINKADSLSSIQYQVGPATGTIVNEGEIRAKGFVALLGKKVHDHGKITITNGTSAVLRSYDGNDEWSCMGDDVIKFAYKKTAKGKKHKIVAIDAAEVDAAVNSTVNVQAANADVITMEGEEVVLRYKKASESKQDVIVDGSITVKGNVRNVNIEGKNVDLGPNNKLKIISENGERTKVKIAGSQEIKIQKGSKIAAHSKNVQPGAVIKIEGKRVDNQGYTKIKTKNGKRGAVKFKGEELNLEGSIKFMGQNKGLVAVHSLHDLKVAKDAGKNTISTQWLSKHLRNNDVTFKAPKGRIEFASADKVIWKESGAQLLLRAQQISFANKLGTLQGSIILEALKKASGTDKPITYTSDAKLKAKKVDIIYRPENYNKPIDYSKLVDTGKTEKFDSKFTSYFGISTPQELQDIRVNLNGNYALLNNIDLKGFKFIPLGYKIDKRFSGVLDGRNRVISNLKLNIKSREELYRMAGEKTSVDINNPTIESHEPWTSFTVDVLCAENGDQASLNLSSPNGQKVLKNLSFKRRGNRRWKPVKDGTIHLNKGHNILLVRVSTDKSSQDNMRLKVDVKDSKTKSKASAMGTATVIGQVPEKKDTCYYSPDAATYFLGLIGAHGGEVANLTTRNMKIKGSDDVIAGSLAATALAGSRTHDLQIHDIDIAVGKESWGGGCFGTAHESSTGKDIDVIGGKVTGGLKSLVGGFSSILHSSHIENANVDVDVKGSGGFRDNKAKGFIKSGVGGFAADIVNSTIVKCKFLGDKVEGNGPSVDIGGFAGRVRAGIIEDSEAHTFVIGRSTGFNIGGFVGDNDEGIISSSLTTSSVKVEHEKNHAGGFVGKNTGTIEDSYATGSVEGGEAGKVGPFFGYNNGDISRCYATGKVAKGETSRSGGFGASHGGTMKDNYFDVDTTGEHQAVTLVRSELLIKDKYYLGLKTVKGVIGLDTETLLRFGKTGKSETAYGNWGKAKGKKIALSDEDTWVLPTDRKRHRPLLTMEKPIKNSEGEYHIYTGHQLIFALKDSDPKRIIIKKDLQLDTTLAGIWAGHGQPTFDGFSGYITGMDKFSKKRHVISGMDVRVAKKASGGMFKEAKDAYFSDIKFAGKMIVEEEGQAGLVAGTLSNVEFKNVGIDASVMVEDKVTVGLLGGQTRNHSYYNGLDINGKIMAKNGKAVIDSSLGGLFGVGSNSLIYSARTNVQFPKTKGSNSYVGGAIGILGKGMHFTEVLSISKFQGFAKKNKGYIGGLAGGWAPSFSFSQCYWNSDSGVNVAIGTDIREKIPGIFEGLDDKQLTDMDSYDWSFWNKKGKGRWVMADMPRLPSEWTDTIEQPSDLVWPAVKPDQNYTLPKSMKKTGMSKWNNGQGIIIPEGIEFVGSVDGQNNSIEDVFVTAKEGRTIGILPPAKDARIKKLHLKGKIVIDAGVDIPDMEKAKYGSLLLSQAVGDSKLSNVEIETTIGAADGFGQAKLPKNLKLAGAVGFLGENSVLSKVKTKVETEGILDGDGTIAALVVKNEGLIKAGYSNDSLIKVAGSSTVTGLVDENTPKGTIQNTYAHMNRHLEGGQVTGLVRVNDGTFVDSYIVNKPSDKMIGTTVARLVQTQNGAMKDIKYNNDVLTKTPAILTDNSRTTQYTGYTFNEMKQRSTFDGWDFKTWNMVPDLTTPFLQYDKFPISIASEEHAARVEGKVFLPDAVLDNHPSELNFNKQFILLPKQRALKEGDLVVLFTRTKRHLLKKREVTVMRYADRHEGLFDLTFKQGVRSYSLNSDIKLSPGLLMKAKVFMQEQGIKEKRIPYTFSREKRGDSYDLDVRGKADLDNFVLIGDLTVENGDIVFDKPVILFDSVTLTADNIIFTETAPIIGQQHNLTLRAAKKVTYLSEIVDFNGLGQGVFDAPEIEGKGAIHALRGVTFKNSQGGPFSNDSKLTLLDDFHVASPWGPINLGPADGEHSLTIVTGKTVHLGSIGKKAPLKDVRVTKVIDDVAHSATVSLDDNIHTTGPIIFGEGITTQLDSNVNLKAARGPIVLHKVVGKHALTTDTPRTDLLGGVDIRKLTTNGKITRFGANTRTEGKTKIKSDMSIIPDEITIDAHKDSKAKTKGGIELGELKNKNGRIEIKRYKNTRMSPKRRVLARLYIGSDNIIIPQIPIILDISQAPVFKQIQDRPDLKIPVAQNMRIDWRNNRVEAHSPKNVNVEISWQGQLFEENIPANNIFEQPYSKTVNIAQLLKYKSSSKKSRWPTYAHVGVLNDINSFNGSYIS